jgi:hypothetical protein
MGATPAGIEKEKDRVVVRAIPKIRRAGMRWRGGRLRESY